MPGLSLRVLLTLIAACLPLAACGGGDSDSSSPVSITVGSIAAIDGWADSTGAFDADGGGPWVGDGVANQTVRQLWAFDLSALPAGATVTSATVGLRQYLVLGVPFPGFGTIVLDHVLLGADLDAADYDSAALSTPGLVSTQSVLDWRLVDVTAAVQADLAAGRTRSDFRARFDTLATDGDSFRDGVFFSDSEGSNGIALKPGLSITYTLPE